MSNSSSFKESNAQFPYVQGPDHQKSSLGSQNYEEICGKIDKNINFYKSYSIPTSPSTRTSGSGNVDKKNYFVDRSLLTYSHRTAKPRCLDDVDDLIQSHIERDEELHFIDNNALGVKPNHSQYENSDNKIASSPISQDAGASNFHRSPITSPIDTSFNSFQFGHSSNRQGGGSMTTKHSDTHVENGTSYGKTASSFKKGNGTSSNPNENVQKAQVKTKLRTMWNNVKYGWRVKREVNLKLDSATWLLGQCYHNKLNDGSVSQDVTRQLKHDLLSKIWLTYRINFPTIPGTDLISDSGWGCMLRCGQMMMAQALVCHFLHRDWRIMSDQPHEMKKMHKTILRWFGDSLSKESPFSLHHLVSMGEKYGRKAGDWYGPTHAAQVLRDTLNQFQKYKPELRNVCMYVALDGIVYKQDVIDICSTSSVHEVPPASSSSRNHITRTNVSNPSQERADLSDQFRNTLFQNTTVHFKHCHLTNFENEIETEMSSFVDPCPSYTEFGPPSFGTVESHWTSLILFVSVRLGNDKINPFYVPCLKSILAYEHCIGIIGGRPKHALYFIGWQEDKLIHMDPHACQPTIDVEKDDFNTKSFHSPSIRTISFSEMDPSCAIGFYFKEKKEFQHFVEKFSEITAPMKRNLDYPVFALAEGRQVDVEEVDMSHSYARSSFSHANNKIDEDDYILL